MIINNRGMPFRATDEKLNRVFHIHPTGCERPQYPILKLEQSLTAFITIPVSSRNRPDLSRNGRDVPKHPHQYIEFMRPKIAKSTNPGNFWVSHPSIIFVEPTFE